MRKALITLALVFAISVLAFSADRTAKGSKSKQTSARTYTVDKITSPSEEYESDWMSSYVRKHPERNKIFMGFFKGNDYARLTKVEKTYWVMGYYDGLAISPLFSSDVMDRISWIYDLAKSNEQFEAIITRYVEQHPENWDQPMNHLALSALIDAHEKKYGFRPSFLKK